MVQTIDGLNPNVTPLGVDEFPAAKGGSNPDLKTTLTQISAFAQSNFSNLSHEIYVSNKQLGTGSGSINNPFATGDEAVAVAVTGSIIIFDVGTYTVSSFTIKPITIVGQGQGLTLLTIGNISLDNTTWQAATNPSIRIQNISISGIIDLTASAIKANSSVIVSNIKSNGLLLNNMGKITVGGNSNIIAVRFTDCNSMSSVDSTTCTSDISITQAALATNPFYKISNCVVPTINTTQQTGNNLTVSLTGFLDEHFVGGLSLNDCFADAQNGQIVTYFDAQSVPVNGFTDVEGIGGAIFLPVTDMAHGITTFNGFGLGNAAAGIQSYAGFTAGVDANFFMGNGVGSGLPPTGTRNFFFAFYNNAGNFSNCIAMGTSVTLTPTANGQAAWAYTNGYGFGAIPKANFDVRAGAKGDFLFSATTAVLDANMPTAGLVNPWVSQEVLNFKYRDAFGAIQQVPLEPTTIVTATGSLPINEKIIIDVASLGVFQLGGSGMNVGDTITVFMKGAGLGAFTPFGAQNIYYLDNVTTGGINQVRTTKQYQFITFKCISSTIILVTSSNGDLQFTDSMGSVGAQSNPLGQNPSLFGKTKCGALNSTSSAAFTISPVAYNTTSGTTIAAADFINGIITVNPSANQTITGPAQTLIDAVLVSKFGSFSAGQYFELTYDNQSAFTSALTMGAGCLLSISDTGVGGSTITVPAFSSQKFKIYKNTATPTFLVFGGDLPASGSGDALLAGNNIFTGLNTFTGAVTDFQKITSVYNRVSGPSIITASSGFSTNPSAPLTTSSFTLTGSQVVNVGVILNGSLASQIVFVPTAANFEAALLASFPGGSTIPVGTSYWMRVINISTTATATLTANTNFLINNSTSSVFLPGQRDNVLIVKTAGTPEYTVY